MKQSVKSRICVLPPTHFNLEVVKTIPVLSHHQIHPVLGTINNAMNVQ